jgi:hypothetical protein
MSVIVSGSIVVSGSTDVGYKTNINGLSLYLDARNSNSYPGSGTTWYDLSTGGNNVSTTLATYSNPSPSNFSITSTNYINFTSSAITTSTCSMEIVFKPTTYAGVYNQLINLTYNIIYVDNGGTVFYWDYVGQQANMASSPINILSLNNWYYFVFEMYSGQPLNNNKMYLNGTQLAVGGGNPLYQTDFNSGMGQLIGDLNQSCSIFRVYNRSLTQQEITNNYNYYKPIFNLS